MKAKIISAVLLMVIVGVFNASCGDENEFVTEQYLNRASVACNAEEAGEEDVGDLEGTVTDKNGAPLSGCEVELWSCCACVYRAKTDANGRYKFDDIIAELYNTKVFGPSNVFDDSNVDVIAGETTTKDFIARN